MLSAKLANRRTEEMILKSVDLEDLKLFKRIETEIHEAIANFKFNVCVPILFEDKTSGKEIKVIYDYLTNLGYNVRLLSGTHTPIDKIHIYW